MAKTPKKAPAAVRCTAASPVGSVTGEAHRCLHGVVDTIDELAAWLLEAGFTEAHPQEHRAGDHFRRFARDELGVRLVHVNDQWTIDLSSPTWGGHWYDVPLVRAAAEHRPAFDDVSLETQVDFVKEGLEDRWARSAGNDAEATGKVLESLDRARARSRFLS